MGFKTTRVRIEEDSSTCDWELPLDGVVFDPEASIPAEDWEPVDALEG